jgi:acyl carrier protein
MTNGTNKSSEEQLLLRDVRALLDQLQLDPEHSLTLDSRLTEDLGVDSLALVELCDQLERTFDVMLPDEVFLHATTPQQWLAAVALARGDTTDYVVNVAIDERRPSPRPTVARLSIVFERILAVAKSIRETRSSRTRQSTSTGATPRTASALYALYAWTLLITFAVGIWLLAVLPFSLARRRRVGRAIARVTCRALGISVSVEGALPDVARASVIAANHACFVDGLVLYAFLDQPLTFVASTDMEHQFLVGRIMRGFDCVFVDRGRAERSADSVERLVTTIRSGQHLLIFPEGSISERQGLRVFRLGAFEAAASSQCPVVPIGIRGTRDILGPGSFLPHRGDARVVIGAAIVPAGRDFSDRVNLRDQVRDAIARLCGDDS